MPRHLSKVNMITGQPNMDWGDCIRFRIAKKRGVQQIFFPGEVRYPPASQE
jgi:hypothetical protein